MDFTRSVSLSIMCITLLVVTYLISFHNEHFLTLCQLDKQDAREAMRVVFSVLTKRICMHKTNFLRIYSNIVLKLILNCMNMQITTELIMMYNL